MYEAERAPSSLLISVSYFHDTDLPSVSHLLHCIDRSKDLLFNDRIKWMLHIIVVDAASASAC